MSILLIGVIIIISVFVTCILKTDGVYPFLKLFKGKYEYQDMEMGMEGVLCRLLCYGLWAIMIYAVIVIAPKREYLFTWFGKRTLAIFIWHSFIITVIMSALSGADFLFTRLPHCFTFAGICVAIIVEVICAYLPEFRIRRNEKRIIQ